MGKIISKSGSNTIVSGIEAQQDHLLGEVRDLIEQARQQVAQTVNSALTLLYWQVGYRIRRSILQERRGQYGEEILPTVSAQLAPCIGGFSARNNK